MGAAESQLTVPQVLSLVQIKPAENSFDIQNLPMAPAGLPMMWEINAADVYNRPHAFCFRFAPHKTYSYISSFQEQEQLCLFSESTEASAGKFTIRLLHLAPMFHIIHRRQIYCTSAPSDLQMI